MKVALVYDHVNRIGGAERVLSALAQIFPKAPLYTAVYEPGKAPWAAKLDVRPSFLQRFPLIRSFHEYFPVLPIFAFESLDLTEFDVVISVSSAEAKAVITNPQSLHICYLLTPTRYLWSHYWQYFNHTFFSKISLPVVCLLRIWDTFTSCRPDVYLAVSQMVAQRAVKYYHQAAAVVYPPVDLDMFKPATSKTTDNYYLVVSRLAKYKRVDLIIKAANVLSLPLKIVGSGLEMKRLQNLSGSTVEFLGNLTDRELTKYYQNCRALIFMAEEDFGLAAVEAQACGKPVIAYSKGGVAEIVQPAISGEFFLSQTSQALIEALKKFSTKSYDIKTCRKQAEKFSLINFKQKFKDIINGYWQKS